MEKDIFYIKTKDGTPFGIYDLELSEENKITFGFGAVNESDSTNGYEEEIQEVVVDVLTKAMKDYMGKC